MSSANRIARWSDKLRDISAMGLRYAKNKHDTYAFRAVQTIAMEMLALATDEPMERIEPLRASVFARPSPLVGGDAAIIDAGGKILLIQRADNGMWAMPGGYSESGETPAEGTLREALEETGVHCRAVSLVGVFDSRFTGTLGPYHLYHFVFLCEPLQSVADEEPTHAIETLGSAWFPQDGLPEELAPGHKARIPYAFRAWRGDGGVFWDRAEATRAMP